MAENIAAPSPEVLKKTSSVHCLLWPDLSGALGMMALSCFSSCFLFYELEVLGLIVLKSQATCKSLSAVLLWQCGSLKNVVGFQGLSASMD